MSLVNFSRFATVLVAFVCTLTACGGGGGGSDDNAQTASSVASNTIDSTTIQASGENQEHLAGVAIAPIESETIQVAPAYGGLGISTSPLLYKSNGAVVQKLEDLPEGISNTAWMKKPDPRLPLKVVLADGLYILRSSWTWGSAQSGRATSPVYVESKNIGGAVVIGAKSITLPRENHIGNSSVTVNLAGYPEVTTFEQLWVNGNRVVRARTPNAGDFFYVKQQVKNWAGAATLGGRDVANQAFLSEGTALSYLQGLTSAERSAAMLVAVHSWTTSHHRIAETNSSNEIRVTPASNWAFLKSAGSQRYFIENIPTALDAAREWYFNAGTKQLSYIPTPGEKVGDIGFSIPVVEQLLSIKGQPSLNKWVEHIHFRGIKFKYAGATLPAEGLIDPQSAVAVPAAVQLTGARNISLSSCEISHVGGYGVWFKENVLNATVSDCEIYDAGAGGVKIGLPNQPDSTIATGSNAITGNRIHATGYQFPGAPAIWIGQSSYNTVEDNLVGDTTYSGISVGWNWGYVISRSHHNQINRNFIYDIMQGSLSDGGGIYTLGVSPGTEIKGNIIKNVHGYNYYGSGAWGIYNDEGSSNILIDSNIVTNTDHGGYMLHYGANNTVKNNVFSGGRYSEIQVGKAEPNLQATLDNNRILPSVSSFVAYTDTSSTPAINYRSNKVSPQFVSMSSTPTYCGSGCSIASSLQISTVSKLEVPVVSDANGAVTLPTKSARAWTGTALQPVLSSPAKLWAKDSGYSFDAAMVTPGTRPQGLNVVPADNRALISVIQDSVGDQCLAFKDGGNMTNRWEPFGYINTGYSTGDVNITFTLKADATTEFVHSWRQPLGSSYLTGPSVMFSGARGVVVRDSVVAPLPLGQWVTITIKSKQGASATWQMELKYQNGEVRNITAQRPESAAWTSASAMYFISNSNVTSTPCIGKWTIANQS